MRFLAIFMLLTASSVALAANLKINGLPEKFSSYVYLENVIPGDQLLVYDVAMAQASSYAMPVERILPAFADFIPGPKKRSSIGNSFEKKRYDDSHVVPTFHEMAKDYARHRSFLTRVVAIGPYNNSLLDIIPYDFKTKKFQIAWGPRPGWAPASSVGSLFLRKGNHKSEELVFDLVAVPAANQRDFEHDIVMTRNLSKAYWIGEQDHEFAMVFEYAPKADEEAERIENARAAGKLRVLGAINMGEVRKAGINDNGDYFVSTAANLSNLLVFVEESDSSYTYLFSFGGDPRQEETQPDIRKSINGLMNSIFVR